MEVFVGLLIVSLWALAAYCLFLFVDAARHLGDRGRH
jgi:hypothetical protein